MASIQQSLNQMLGSVAGIATAGTYLYTQSDAYKAGQKEKEAKGYERLADKAMDRFLETPEDRTGEIYEEARELEEQAYHTAPTETRAKRYLEIQTERAGEAEYESEKQRLREKAEREAAERYAIRAQILGTTESQLRAREEMLKNKGGAK